MTTLRITLRLAALFLLLATLATLHAAETSKPNIVFILADDLGCMDLGAFNPKTFYETPNIDSLAKRGMKFTQGHAACYVTDYPSGYAADVWFATSPDGHQWTEQGEAIKIGWTYQRVFSHAPVSVNLEN